MYLPIAAWVEFISRHIGKVQQGRISIYLLYSFVTLIALLVFVIFYNWSEAMFSNLTPEWFMTLLATMKYAAVKDARTTPAERWAQYQRKARPVAQGAPHRARTPQA